MGQGCSSALESIIDGSRADRFADSPDLVMHEIVHSSVATVRYLRERALRERFGECLKKDICRGSLGNGQEHLLFHNIQEKQGDMLNSTAPARNSPPTSTHKRKGRKIAESFEADRPRDVALQEDISTSQPKVEVESKISEAAIENFEFAISKTIATACPTRLWIRRRIQRRQKRSKREEEQPKEENPEVLMLEEGTSYLKNEDYFGTNSVNEQAPIEGKKSNSEMLTGPQKSTHIYAIRYSEGGNCENLSIPIEAEVPAVETRHKVPSGMKRTESSPQTAVNTTNDKHKDATNNQHEDVSNGIYNADNMKLPPERDVVSWTTVSEKHNIYVVDLGLTPKACDDLVTTTEQACRGRYAAYTYAKQTLGCREYPLLAQAALGPVHSMVGAIFDKFDGFGPGKKEKAKRANLKDGTIPIQQNLQLDDREPHIVKYDVTKKERQKLDMHTDKSEWTFLIALSNGCGLDYDGGGTYFECLDATVHIQKGHALVFPGKLRHKGQAIYHGLRFLLVGFLVDKSEAVVVDASKATNSAVVDTSGTDKVVSSSTRSATNRKDVTLSTCSGTSGVLSTPAAPTVVAA